MPSTLLWQRLVADVEANAPWQRLRRSLLLLLQLLLVLILVFLAARPFVERPAGPRGRPRAGHRHLGLDAGHGRHPEPARGRQGGRGRRAQGPARRRQGQRDRGRPRRPGSSPTGRPTSGASGRPSPASSRPSDIGNLADALRLAVGARGALGRRRDPRRDRRRAGDAAERRRPGADPGPARSAATPTTRRSSRSRSETAAERPVAQRVRLGRQPRPRAGRAPGPGVRRRAAARLADAAASTPSAGRTSRSTTSTTRSTRPRWSRCACWAPTARARPRRTRSGSTIGRGRSSRPTSSARSCSPAQPDPYLETALSFLPDTELYFRDGDDWSTLTGLDEYELVIFNRFLPPTLPAKPTLAIAPPRTTDLGTVTGTLTQPGHRHARPVGPDPALRRPLDGPRRRGAGAGAARLGAGGRPGPAGLAAAVRRRPGRPARPRSWRSSRAARTCRSQVAFPVLLANLAGELMGGSDDAARRRRPRLAGHARRARGRRAGSAWSGPTAASTSWSRRRRARASVTFARTDLLGVYTVTPLAGPDASPAAVERVAGRRRAAPSPPRAPTAMPASPTFRPPRRALRPGSPSTCSTSTSPCIAPGDPARLTALGTPAAAAPERGAAPVERPNARDELWIPIVADRARPAHARVAGLRARHARAPAPRPWRRGSAGRGRPGGAPDGHRLRRPERAPAAAAAAGGRDRPPPVVAAPAGQGTAARRARWSAALLLAALVGALAGPPARAASRPAGDRVRRRPVGLGRHGRARGRRSPSCASRWREAGRGRGGDRRVRRATRSSSGCPSDLAEIDRIASTPVRDATDIGARAAARGRAVPRRHPEADRAPVATATTRPARGQSEAALAAARGIQVETVLDRPGRPRRGPRPAPDAPSTARARRGDRRVTATSPRRSPSPPPCACSATASWSARSRSTSRRAPTRVTFNFTPKDAGFHTLPDGGRGGPRHVQPERPGRREHDRQGRAQGAGREGRRGGGGGAGRRRSRPSARTSTRSSPRACRRTWPGLADYDSIVLVDVPRTAARPTRRWRRSRSTSATSAAGW